MQGWRLSSLGAFLVTMAHDWSHNIDRKNVSNKTNKNHIEQLKCQSDTNREIYNNPAKLTSLHFNPQTPCHQSISPQQLVSSNTSTTMATHATLSNA